MIIIWESDIGCHRRRLALVVVCPRDWMRFTRGCDPEHEFDGFAARVEEEIVDD